MQNSSNDPRYPKPWTVRTPLALLGEVEGFNSYDTGRHVANWRLTPASNDDEREPILLHLTTRRASR